MQVFQGRPENVTGRQERELRVYELLDALEISYERVDHEEAHTMEACHEIDVALDTKVCKNLFLCNRQKTQFYLLMMPGDKPFKTKELSAQIQSARLSFAGEESMVEYLDIYPGAVSVLGLMNDRDNHVQLLIDEDILKDEYLGCHPCVCTSSLKVRITDITQVFLPAVHHDYKTVALYGVE